MLEFEITAIKNKTNQGLLYYDFDENIDKAREHAFKTCRQYNQGLLNKEDVNAKQVKNLFGNIGSNVTIAGSFLCEFGFNLNVGNNVFFGDDFKIIDCNLVTIGNDVYIGKHVGMYTSNHAEEPNARANHWVKDLPITIGNNVYIGDNVVIGPNTVIGDNAVIKSGSVVVKNVSPNQIVEGDPAQ